MRRFIDDLAAMLAPWGMQPAVGALYAYLLIRPDPATLDDIAEDLGMAKSSASVAARLLERHRLARKFGERGSRRVRYGRSDSPAGFIEAQAALLGDLSRMITTRSAAVAKGETLDRLHDLAGFYASMEQAIETGLKSHSRKSAAKKGGRRRS